MTSLGYQFADVSKYPVPSCHGNVMSPQRLAVAVRWQHPAVSLQSCAHQQLSLVAARDATGAARLQFSPVRPPKALPGRAVTPGTCPISQKDQNAYLFPLKCKRDMHHPIQMKPADSENRNGA
ncbi:Protein of unknown function [Gryllus bimaculatus]|nr:Protein of unknown function [Gryllus bimaculatus]